MIEDLKQIGQATMNAMVLLDRLSKQVAPLDDRDRKMAKRFADELNKATKTIFGIKEEQPSNAV